MADDGVLLVNRVEAARRLGIGVRKVWTLTNTGELMAVKVGRAVRYRVADLEAFTAGLPAAGTGDCPPGLHRGDSAD